MLDWLGTVPVIINIYKNWWITKAVQPPSRWQTISQIDWYFIAYILPLDGSFPLYCDVQTIKEQNLQTEEKHLVMRKNIGNDPQQWDQWPRHLVHYISILTEYLSVWVHYQWQIIFTTNWQITEAV